LYQQACKTLVAFVLIALVGEVLWTISVEKMTPALYNYHHYCQASRVYLLQPDTQLQAKEMGK